jgi:hypothetical protein
MDDITGMLINEVFPFMIGLAIGCIIGGYLWIRRR